MDTKIEFDKAKTPEQNVAELPPDAFETVLAAALKAKAAKARAQRRWRAKGGAKQQVEAERFRRAVHRAAVKRKKTEDQLAREARAHAKTATTRN